MNRRHCLALLAAMPAGLLPGRLAHAEIAPINAHDGIAIGGADTVCYLTEQAYVPGLPNLTVMWRGAAWQFSRPETMAAFEMDPTAYCPQFGGYCALALSRGIVTDSDPAAFLLYDGAVYLFTSPSALAAAQDDIPGMLAAALANWPAVLDG